MAFRQAHGSCGGWAVRGEASAMPEAFRTEGAKAANQLSLLQLFNFLCGL